MTVNFTIKIDNNDHIKMTLYQLAGKFVRSGIGHFGKDSV